MPPTPLPPTPTPTPTPPTPPTPTPPTPPDPGVGRLGATPWRELAPPSGADAFATLVRAQFGVVSATQLRRIGWSGRTISRRVAQGSLHVVHRGVFAVGHTALRDEGRWVAALLAVGDGAVLSHFSAAEMLGLGAPPRARVHVTTPNRNGRAQHGVAVHRTRRLSDDEVCVRRGLPCTTVARTIVDLADGLPGRDVERLIEAAELRGVLDLGELVEGYERAVGRRGRRRLARAVGGYRPLPERTRSAMEARFLRLCRRHGLRAPVVNATVDGFEVDFSWPERKVAVETDGWEFHRSRAAFGRDRRRDLRLAVAGWTVVRITWAELEDEPARIAADLRALL